MVRKDNRMYAITHARWILRNTIIEIESLNKDYQYISSRQYPITIIDEMKEALEHIEKAIDILEWDIQ